VGRDYSRSKQFLPWIRCQTSFGLPGTIKADEVSRPELGGGPGKRILASIGSPQAQIRAPARGSFSIWTVSEYVR
jgi:hypothetical protein